MREATYAIAATVKDGDVYLLSYDRNRPAEAINEIARWACNRELNLTWLDAARLSNRVRLKAYADGMGTNGFYFHGG